MVYNRAYFLVAIVALLSGGSAYGQSRPSDAELAKTLRAGGHIIVIRHGATHADQADTDPLNQDNIAQQRQLNANGEAAAKALGVALGQIGVPVGQGVHEPLQSRLPDGEARRLR